MLSRFRRQNAAREAADRLHAAIVDRSRAPVFYVAFAVPDTVDGRFDLVALHAFLAMDALKRQGAAGEEVATHLATALFAGFEDALRDLGVGDFGLSRRIKALANAFYGRLEAYAAAESEPDIAEAVLRNIYRDETAQAARASVLARYMMNARSHVEACVATSVTAGAIDFGPLPEAEST